MGGFVNVSMTLIMTRILHLMRHAETEIDPNIPASDWQLTEDGLCQAEELASVGIFSGVDGIFSSTESKALQTARPFADRLGIEIMEYSEFRELNRGTEMLSDTEYLHSVEGLLNRSDAVPGWELREHAMNRFQTRLERIMNKGDFREGLLISHGLVLSMHFADLLQLDDVFSRWKRLRFCAWGTIQANLVIKDIV
ncbi:MAG: histidine phosphatase family protein [Promethearchaeota archaeon]